jgi:hypothetical protein
MFFFADVVVGLNKDKITLKNNFNVEKYLYALLSLMMD